jgi:hypothetical protein
MYKIPYSACLRQVRGEPGTVRWPGGGENRAAQPACPTLCQNVRQEITSSPLMTTLSRARIHRRLVEI